VEYNMKTHLRWNSNDETDSFSLYLFYFFFDIYKKDAIITGCNDDDTFLFKFALLYFIFQAPFLFKCYICQIVNPTTTYWDENV